MPDMPVPSRGTYLIRGGTVLSMDPDRGILSRGDVLVRDGAIVEVATEIEAAADTEVIDAADMIVMPGLVETHFHMWSGLGRNFIARDFEYFPAKWATSAHYQPEDFYRSVKLGLVDAVNAGITTVHNWSHNTRTPAHADAELAAHRDGLIRARYSYGHRDLLPEDEPLDFTDIDRVSDEWFPGGSDFTKLVHLGVNLRGPDIADAAVFDRETPAARERGLPISIHTMQGGSTKVRAADLEDKGLLGPDFLICHYLAATEEDRKAMARTSTPLSFSVHSELRLGDSGDPRTALLKMLAAGVSVSLSIDATSIAPVNLFEAMHIAWNMGIPWLGTDTSEFEPLSSDDCIRMATINGAQALGLADVTGSLTPGKRADLILLRKRDINVAPVADVESTIVRSVTPANVDTVISDGRILKRHGDLVAFDVDRVIREAEESADAVRRRAGGRLAPSD